MFGANSILDMGRWALFASQMSIRVTGENIANVNTEGYSRRSVRLEEGTSIDYRPGQMGTGVRAAEVMRHFDKYVEMQYLDQASSQSRYTELYDGLRTVEALFNESQGLGISDNISAFFNSWNDLTQRADDYGTRKALLDTTATLTSTLRSADADLELMQNRVDELITYEVQNANEIIERIAAINNEIAVHENVGINEPNRLFDERSQLTRDLAEIIDINIIDLGENKYTVMTKGGQVLVDRDQHYELEFAGPATVKQLDPDSDFAGTVYFDGQDNYEYTIDILTDGVVGSAGTPNVATFRVSLDGGDTWLLDEDGAVKEFSARPEAQSVQANDLGLWFGMNSNSRISPTGTLNAGDTFTIRPQSGLYWVENTSHKENITPQIDFTGIDDPQRTTGGRLAGLFNLRDSYVGKYRDKLDAFAENLIWEVNRLHSQGVGLSKFDHVDGTYGVADTTFALGSDASGLTFHSKIAAGSVMFYCYDKSTGLQTSGAALDFSDAAGQQNFDPEVHNLEDVADAFNRTFGDHLTASIVNNKLSIDADSDKQFAFGADSTGLMAALGVNTLFDGTDATDITLNTKITGQLDYLATGHVNGSGEGNAGDNNTALAIADLQEKNVTIYTVQEGRTTQSLLDYYNGIVGNIGSDVSNVQFSQEYFTSMAEDLNDRQQELAGVNLDEEMANLIRYQHSYTAAAKLITTADQMLQTVLSMKP